MVTKAISRYVLSNSNIRRPTAACQTITMLMIITKEKDMFYSYTIKVRVPAILRRNYECLRDIGFILKKGQVNHGIVTIDDGNNSNNNKPVKSKINPTLRYSLPLPHSYGNVFTAVLLLL
jgi:hypothetical protein